MKHSEYADGLRHLADWLEAHPEVDAPESEISCYGMNDREEAAAVLAACGTCEKKYTDGLFSILKKFGPVTLRYVFHRNAVCVKRVVGTKVVPASVVPAREEQVIPEHEEEIVEWDCAEPLLKAREAV